MNKLRIEIANEINIEIVSFFDWSKRFNQFSFKITELQAFPGINTRSEWWFLIEE